MHQDNDVMIMIDVAGIMMVLKNIYLPWRRMIVTSNQKIKNIYHGAGRMIVARSQAAIPSNTVFVALCMLALGCICM